MTPSGTGRHFTLRPNFAASCRSFGGEIAVGRREIEIELERNFFAYRTWIVSSGCALGHRIICVQRNSARRRSPSPNTSASQTCVLRPAWMAVATQRTDTFALRREEVGLQLDRRETLRNLPAGARWWRTPPYRPAPRSRPHAGSRSAPAFPADRQFHFQPAGRDRCHPSCRNQPWQIAFGSAREIFR